MAEEEILKEYYNGNQVYNIGDQVNGLEYSSPIPGDVYECEVDGSTGLWDDACWGAKGGFAVGGLSSPG